MAGVKLFLDKGNLPSDQYASLREHLGVKPRVLAWGASADGPVVALDDRFCVREADGWHDTPWHLVLSGGLAEGGVMRWRTLDGGAHEVTLVTQGRFPDAFRDRVEATILVQRQLVYAPGRMVVVSARRDLRNPTGDVVWSVHGGRGVSLDDPVVSAWATAELARLQREYAF